MKQRFTVKLSISLKGRFRKLWQLLQNIVFGLCFIFFSCLTFTTITLVSASSRPVDGFFVLGGSIRREIHAAQLAKQYPQIPILISQGSLNPCTWIVF